MPIEFVLPFKDSPFGRLSDPQIPVAVRTARRPNVYRFLVDTGADFTLVPRWRARQVSLDWERMPRASISGVEGAGVPARMGILPVRIGELDLDLRCFFVDRPDALFILGRADFLDRFTLTVDQPRRRIILEAVDA